MLLDTTEPFGHQYSNDDNYRQAMLAIQAHQVDRGAATTWANHLRFLTTDIEPRLTSNNESTSSSIDLEHGDDSNIEGSGSENSETYESEPDCVCADHDAINFKKNGRQLRLTGAEELPQCFHYIALSYCWQSTNNASNCHAINNYSINTPEGMRQNKVNSEVLDRVIAFARPRKVAFIWIDQECINQDDEKDQREGIQAMDLVYQRSWCCMGLLNVRITEQKHIDALNTMFEGEGIDDNQLYALAEALELILSDPWFTRAWILQESLTGAAQMMLQLKCDPHLEKGDILESMFGLSNEYLEIELTQLHTYLSTWLPNTVDGLVADSSSGHEISNRLYRVMGDWFGMVPPIFPLDHQHEPNLRLACNAAAAVSYLNRRKNTIVADRIAIMANLCGYDIRLNPTELDRLGFNFSLCAFVLSIINGDMSMLQGYVHPMSNVSGKTEASKPQSHFKENKPVGFTWCLPKSATLDSLRYHETDLADSRFQLRPGILTASGWLLDGWVWYFDHKIDLVPLRTRLAVKWDLADLQKSPAQTLSARPFLVDMIIQLLCFLRETGYTGIFTLLWDLLRLRPTKRELQNDPAAGPYSEASFDEIVDAKTGQITRPNPLILHRRPVQHQTDPFQALDDQRKDVRLIFEAILVNGFLLVGRLDESIKSPETYQALFDGATVGNLYFTPAEYSEGRIAERHFNRWHARAFRVSKTNRRSPEDCEVFTCHGLVAGEWPIDPARIERVCLG